MPRKRKDGLPSQPRAAKHVAEVVGFLDLLVTHFMSAPIAVADNSLVVATAILKARRGSQGPKPTDVPLPFVPPVQPSASQAMDAATGSAIPSSGGGAAMSLADPPARKPGRPPRASRPGAIDASAPTTTARPLPPQGDIIDPAELAEDLAGSDASQR